MKDKLLKIINHYGVNHQLRKFQEEVFELNEAIINYESTHHIKKDHIIEELADCCVMLFQFVEYYKIDYDDINKIAEQKVNRQLKRMENE